MPKEYYLYVNGQRVKVSEQIYKVYWREKEHEKYLEQVDKKNHLLFLYILNLIFYDNYQYQKGLLFFPL